MTFGEKLKDVREKNNLTQEQLGENLFVSRQVVSKWETGVRYPDLLTAKKIAELFDLSVDYFLDEDKLEQYSEKQEIVEDKKGSMIISSIYTVISIVSFTKAIPQLINIIMNYQSSFYSQWQPLAIQILKLSVGLILCCVAAFTFIKTINAGMNPKLAGYIGIGMLISYCANNCLVVNLMGYNLEHIILIVFSILFSIIIGLYFIKGISKLYKLVIVFAVLTLIDNIISFVFHIYSLISYSQTYLVDRNDITSVTSLILELSVVGIIIVQAVALERKRKLNK